MKKESCLALLAAISRCQLEEFNLDVNDEEIKDLEDALAILAPRQKEALLERYDGAKPKTVRQTGEKLGVSRQRVYQLETASFRRLRHHMNRKRFKILDKAWKYARCRIETQKKKQAIIN